MKECSMHENTYICAGRQALYSSNLDSCLTQLYKLDIPSKCRYKPLLIGKEAWFQLASENSWIYVTTDDARAIAKIAVNI